MSFLQEIIKPRWSALCETDKECYLAYLSALTSYYGIFPVKPESDGGCRDDAQGSNGVADSGCSSDSNDDGASFRGRVRAFADFGVVGGSATSRSARRKFRNSRWRGTSAASGTSSFSAGGSSWRLAGDGGSVGAAEKDNSTAVALVNSISPERGTFAGCDAEVVRKMRESRAKAFEAENELRAKEAEMRLKQLKEGGGEVVATVPVDELKVIDDVFRILPENVGRYKAPLVAAAKARAAAAHQSGGKSGSKKQKKKFNVPGDEGNMWA